VLDTPASLICNAPSTRFVPPAATLWGSFCGTRPRRLFRRPSVWRRHHAHFERRKWRPLRRRA